MFGLGIDVIDVRIKRADLPEANYKSVFERMRAERTRVASELRAKGAEEAEKIRAEADQKATITIADAYGAAERTRGEGDAKAAEVYARAYGQDPEFYRFYRSLQAYREAMRGKQDVLVLEPDASGGHRDMLFVEPNPGRGDPTFFNDRNKGELWVGPRLGVEQSAARFGVHECRGLPKLESHLEKLRTTAARPWRVLRGMSERTDRALPAQDDRDKAFATVLSEMRLIKDALEIRELSAVIASTMRSAISSSRPARALSKSHPYV